VTHRNTLILMIVVTVAFGSGAVLLQRRAPGTAEVYGKARVLSGIVQRVADFYVDSLEQGQLYDLAIDGMLQGLGDPYTGFLRAEELEDLMMATRGDYSGLGLRIEVTDGWLTVVTPMAGTPADEAGLEAGDRIVEVEGVGTYGWSAERASAALRGDPGTAVELTVVRPGLPELLGFNVERGEIHVTSVRHADMVAPGIGYVRLESVGAQAAEELAEAVSRLRAAGARGLLLDMRYNPGGLLDQGVAVSDLFLEPGDAVVSTRGRIAATSHTYEAGLPARWSDMPLVVLVNEFSASAAEIIAGALQDHDRALVLGSPSFGKGVVQTVFQVNRTEALRLTTSRWYTPSGRSIHRDREPPFFPEESATTDTVVVSPEFRSDAGRALRGGGGIHPDVVVLGDTATVAERRFQRQLGVNVQTFVDVVSSYALELKGTDLVADPEAFVVTGGMRAEVRRRLRAREVTMPGAVWNAAADFIDHELRRRTLRYTFGPDVEMRFETARDGVVRAAIALLERAVSQEELFELSEGM
jgi:carboxyl-terminal processing protease